jgi:mannose-6-phosphate isomerase-like protein (cupin superfamily)
MFSFLGDRMFTCFLIKEPCQNWPAGSQVDGITICTVAGKPDRSFNLAFVFIFGSIDILLNKNCLVFLLSIIQPLCNSCIVTWYRSRCRWSGKKYIACQKNSMVKYAQLSQRFDAKKMQADVMQLEASCWKQHYNKQHYDGEWTVLPLRSLDGGIENIYSIGSPGAGVTDYRDTPLLENCHYLQEVLSYFQCEKTAVRLMKLHAGAVIKEHRDTALSLEDGEARLHLPVVTNAAVSFELDNEKLHLQEGECWYLNLSLKHSVRNDGSTDRVHLVVDCRVNDWLHEQLTTQVQLVEQVEVEEEPRMVVAEKIKMINELRLMNTPVSLELAAKLENGLL